MEMGDRLPAEFEALRDAPPRDRQHLFRQPESGRDPAKELSQVRGRRHVDHSRDGGAVSQRQRGRRRARGVGDGAVEGSELPRRVENGRSHLD